MLTDQREQLLSELGGQDDYGVLLVAQMGGVPNEIQLMIETARYDEAVQGLRPRGGYIIRALGVFEHRVHLGVFSRAQFLDEHPLLLHHNFPKVAVEFEGRPARLHELVLDLFQAFVSTFGPWRNLAEWSQDLNPSAPLVTLLAGGGGLLGVMPQPLAERMGRVLAAHDLKVQLTEQPGFEAVDEHGRSRLSKLLLIDASYVIALDFSVDTLVRKS